MTHPQGFEDKVAFVWKVADKLRGHFKQHEYGSVTLPLLVLRRLDAVLEPTKQQVLAQAAGFETIGPGQDRLLKKTAGFDFYNTSPLTLTAMLSDDKNIAENLGQYIHHLSPAAADVMDAYNFADKIDRMDRAGILYAVVGDFADLDLRPSQVDNAAMGYIFEELLRKFSEMSNETAGEHYTPREVIALMVNLLLTGPDADEVTASPKPVRSVYDPAAGTGGMLTTAIDHITDLNPDAIVNVYGQELNPETWAIARSELMLQEVPPEQMAIGNSLTASDAYAGKPFDYILANPPYGVDWKAYAQPIRDEHTQLGFEGRYGAGLPRVSDGSLLFLQHMISKMKPAGEDSQGSRVAIVLSGSPLFSGGAGSGESEIRRWIIENDWLEGIVALPDQMFYNTGISTYVWILTNDKPADRRGTVALVDAREMGTKMRKSLGDKRKELTQAAITEAVQLYEELPDDERVKVLDNATFGFQRITVERPMRRRWEFTEETLEVLPEEAREAYTPLVGQSWSTAKELEEAVKALPGETRAKDVKALSKAACIHDPDADPITKRGGAPEPDPDLRDQENIPLPTGYLQMSEDERTEALRESAESHLREEILPYVPDAWIDHKKARIGYEIPFTRHFYTYEPPRPVEEIAKEIRDLEGQIQEWMRGLGL